MGQKAQTSSFSKVNKALTLLVPCMFSQEKDETDSGYRSGTIPDEKLPPKPSEATLNREELRKRIAEFNKLVQGANFALVSWFVCLFGNDNE